MCDEISSVVRALPETDRRNFLRLMGAGAGVAVAGGLLAGAPAASASTLAGQRNLKTRTRIVLLGTSGGPQLLPGGRTGVSTAIVFDNRYYIVDLGWGSNARLVQAGLGSSMTGTYSAMNNLSAVFLTHMHSDHLAEWPAMYMTGSPNTLGRSLPPIRMFGPPDREVPPVVHPPGRVPPPLVNPEDPGLGIEGFTERFRLANSADFNDRIRDQGQRDPNAVFSVANVDLRGVQIGADGIPPRMAEPLPVWIDGEVTITATLVDHRPTAPALAYRFDTPDGSIVISGDTTVSENLIDLAQGCDFLVHEVIDPVYVDKIVAALPPAVGESLRQHLLASHTTIEQVGRDVAQPAGAKNLVLTHMNPETTNGRWRRASNGYAGRVIVGSDLLDIPLK